MTRIILGVLIGTGIVFTILAIIEKEEQQKINKYEKWRHKLP